MMMPMSYTNTAMNPIEIDRLESGRPASHLEVFQSRQRAMREDAMAIAIDGPETGNGRTSLLQIVPDALESVRHAIGRLFSHDGQRMGHEAA